jgi:hypothetical protein
MPAAQVDDRFGWIASRPLPGGTARKRTSFSLGSLADCRRADLERLTEDCGYSPVGG